MKKSIFRHICIIVSLFIGSNTTYAKTNITDKLKHAIQTLGDKVHNVINIVKHKVEKEEIDTQVKQKHKSKIKIQKIIVHLPPPDAEIFKKYPIDITMSRPTVVSNNGIFIVNDVWIYEKTGDLVSESMDIAIKNAMDIGFSNLILEKNLQHIKFTMLDAINCLDSIYVDQEKFYENEYIGRFTINFNSEMFEKVVGIKKYDLFIKGLNEYSQVIDKLTVKIPIFSKKHWLEIEKQLGKSKLPYIINGFSNEMAIITIGNQNNENIMEILAINGLKIILDNNNYYIRLI